MSKMEETNILKGLTDHIETLAETLGVVVEEVERLMEYSNIERGENNE